MRVEVRLFATLAAYLPPGSEGGSAFVEVPDGTTVAELAGRLGIPEDLPRVVLINDREASPDRVLHPGDVVTLFPPLAGGATSRAPQPPAGGRLKRL